MASPNIYWKSAIDFRDFDISVPSFSYQNNINRSVEGYSGPITLEDELTLQNSVGSPQNDSFAGAGITRTGQEITGGLLSSYVDNRPGGINGYILTNAWIAAVELNDVIDSASLADDKAFLRRFLSGTDYIELSGGAGGTATDDYVFSGAGDDRMYGNGGRDSLFGDNGLDSVYGGGGRDLIFGGLDADLLVGGALSDILYGGRGADILTGSQGADSLRGDVGNDTLSGGQQRDVFIFRKGYGTDTITDFQDGVDRIRIEAVGGSEVNIEVNYSGGNATVTFQNVTVIVENVATNSLDLGTDIILVPI